MGYHAAITGEDRLDAVFFHPLQDFLLQGFLLSIPTVGIGTAPTFQVVHGPPGQESRTGDETVHFIAAIAQLQQHVTPHTFHADSSERQVDAVQSHPVDLLFPTLPVPERHGIGISTIIEIITQTQVCLFTQRLADRRKHIGQLGLHTVPRQLDTGVIFQIPVKSGCDIDIGIAAHHDLRTFLIQFKEVLVAFLQLDDKLTRSTLVYPLQQTVYRISPSGTHRNKKQ